MVISLAETPAQLCHTLPRWLNEAGNENTCSSSAQKRREVSRLLAARWRGNEGQEEVVGSKLKGDEGYLQEGRRRQSGGETVGWCMGGGGEGGGGGKVGWGGWTLLIRAAGNP
jgi:hypothetical protein